MSDTLRETWSSLSRFVRHPFEEIARLPAWRWQQALLLQWSAAVVSGVLAGLLPFSLWKILQGAILFPMAVTVMAALLAVFLYYYFQVFENRIVPFHRLFHLTVLANLPFLATHILATWLSLFDVLGLLATALLMIVGLTENFGVDKARSIRVIGFAFGLLFTMWAAEKILTS